jgi:hypothetical protein
MVAMVGSLLATSGTWYTVLKCCLIRDLDLKNANIFVEQTSFCNVKDQINDSNKSIINIRVSFKN